jgi:5'-nucleotidase
MPRTAAPASRAIEQTAASSAVSTIRSFTSTLYHSGLMQTRVRGPAWDEIDTVLVDMDGTLLDLAFDNFFWLSLVPARYAELHGLAVAEASERLIARYASFAGTLSWYCTDHWTRELGLDIKAMKWAHKHLIRFLPKAPEFLASVRARGKDVWIVTNAHRETIEVKASQTGIDALVDRLVCSHDLAAPKESAGFWRKLRTVHGFHPGRALLIDDSAPVLRAARTYGVKHTIAVRRPDSTAPAREIEEFMAVEGVAELV